MSAPCVFCRPEMQPPRLLETERLFVIPDKYPLIPGHTLIITRQHLRCYGFADRDTHAELDRTAGAVTDFLQRSYGGPVLRLENGIAGQTVFHAHLHLIPVRMNSFGERLPQHPDVVPVEGWEDVTRYLATRGHYRYLAIEGRRYLVSGYSPILAELHRLLADATGLRFGPNGWEKRTTPDDVHAVEQRWHEWTRLAG